jgi:hypothetical protein
MIILFLFLFTYLSTSHSRIWPKEGKSPATFTEMDTAWVIGRLLSAISLCHAQVKEKEWGRQKDREPEIQRQTERRRDRFSLPPSRLPILIFCPLPTSYHASLPSPLSTRQSPISMLPSIFMTSPLIKGYLPPRHQAP